LGICFHSFTGVSLAFKRIAQFAKELLGAPTFSKAFIPLADVPSVVRDSYHTAVTRSMSARRRCAVSFIMRPTLSVAESPAFPTWPMTAYAT
jgi:hypothetical protein